MSFKIFLYAIGLLLFFSPLYAVEDTTQTEDVTICYEHAFPAEAIKDNMQMAWRPGSQDQASRKSRTSKRNQTYSLGNPFKAIVGFFRAMTPRPAGNWFRPRPQVPLKGPAHPKGTFVFDPRTVTWAAYDSHGDLVSSGNASGGRDYCPDVNRGCRTPSGRYKVFAKGDETCVSNTYPLGNPGAPMPHCMYFKGGYAIHGAYDVPNWNASHGCIRVTPSDAAWLHRNFVQHGTVVVVKPY